MRALMWQIAEQWLEAAVREAGITSADKFYAWLRDNGLYVTRSIVRDVWKEYKYAFPYLEVIQRLDPAHLIPRSWYRETESEYINRYAYKYEITFYNPEEGTSETRTMLVRSDTPLTRKDAEWAAWELASEYGDMWQLEVAKIDFVSAFHRRGASW